MTQGDLARVLKDVFSRYRSRIAVQTLAGRQYCYGDLDQMSQRFAIQLRAGRGDRVVALLDKSPEALILYLACLRAGAVFVPLNPALPPDELTFFLADAEPTRVVCAPRLEDAVRSSLPNVGSTVVRTLDDQGGGSLFGCPPNPLPSPAAGARASEDLPPEAAAFLYTSGTTGRSKGAVLTQANLESNGGALCRAWGFSTQDVLLHALPLFHVHGLFVACHCTLLAGARMLFLPRFNLQEVLTALPHCTVLMGVPTYYSRLLAAGLNQRQLGRMRLWISGSAPLHEDVFATFAEQTGQEILERYGMTETLITTSNPLRGPRRPGSVGPAVQGVDVTVVSDSGDVLPRGHVGEVAVRGPSVFAGYHRQPDQTADAFLGDGSFLTGDLGYLDEEGYLSLVGRKRELVISGGENVYPKEVELVLDRFEEIAESAVIGVSHPDLGEAVVAVVTWTPGRPAPDPEALRTKLKASLAPHQVPKCIVGVEALPRSALGKVQKHLLQQQYARLFLAE